MCEVFVSSSSASAQVNPRCSCGHAMKKPYARPKIVTSALGVAPSKATREKMAAIDVLDR
jgi:hypothetical protein